MNNNNRKRAAEREARQANGQPAAISVLRLSRAEMNDTEGVDRQRDWCRRRAAADGRTLLEADELMDNNVGASKHSKNGGQRENFNELLRRIQTGNYGAVYATEPSRIIRSAKMFREVLDACSSTGTELVFKDGSGFQPGNRFSRFLCQIIAEMAELETDLMQERMLFANDARLVRGLPMARTRMFGWTDTSRTELHPVEAPAVQEVVAMLLSGESKADCVRWLNGQQLRSVNGNEWSITTLRNYITNPALAGWSTVTGPNGRATKWKMPEAEEDAWLPIISDADHSKLIALFRDKKRANPDCAYPLTRLVVDCNGTLMTASKSPEGKRRYRTDQRLCKEGNGYVAMYAEPLEAAVMNAVANELRQTNLADWMNNADDAAAWQTAVNEQEAVAARLSDLAFSRFQKNEIDAETYSAVYAALMAEKEAADNAAADAMASMRNAAVLSRFTSTEALAAALPQMPAAELHAVYADLFTSVEIGKPASRRETDYNSTARILRINWKKRTS